MCLWFQWFCRPLYRQFYKLKEGLSGIMIHISKSARTVLAVELGGDASDGVWSASALGLLTRHLRGTFRATGSHALGKFSHRRALRQLANVDPLRFRQSVPTKL